MTRTRQSTAHGRRGAFRRDVVTALQKKVQKPRSAVSVGQKPSTKGRYTCGQCRKFHGPRKSVEDHCRGKHKLTGSNLQKAVLIITEVRKEVKAGPSREPAPPLRTLKRQRGTAADKGASNEVGVTNVKIKRETSPVKEKNSVSVIGKADANVADAGTNGRDLQVASGDKENVEGLDQVTSSGQNIEKEGEKSPVNQMDKGGEGHTGSEVSVEAIIMEKPSKVTSETREGVTDLESLNNEGMITGASQSSEGKVPPVQISESMCGKCKRTFSRARQLTKHKCFASVKEKPEQPPKTKPTSPEKGIKTAKISSPHGLHEYYKTKGPEEKESKSPEDDEEGHKIKAQATGSPVKGPGKKISKSSKGNKRPEKRKSKSSKGDEGGCTIKHTTNGPENKKSKSSKGHKIKVQATGSPVMEEMETEGAVSQIIPACKTGTATAKLMKAVVQMKAEGTHSQVIPACKAERAVAKKAPTGTPIQYKTAVKTLLSLPPEEAASSPSPEVQLVEKERTNVTKVTAPVMPNTVLKPGKAFKTVEIPSGHGLHEVQKEKSKSSMVDPPVMPNTVLKSGTHPSVDISQETPDGNSSLESHPVASPPSPGATQKVPPVVDVTIETDEVDIPLEDILQSLEEFVQVTETADESEAFKKKGMTKSVDASKSSLKSPSTSDASVATSHPAATKPKNVQRPRKDPNLVVKHELLADHKEKIAESIRLQTEPVAIPEKTAEKVRIAIQNGSPFCVCSFCGKVTVCPDLMKEHLSTHIRDYFPFQCPSCEFLASKRGRITAHMKTEHGGYLKCEQCSYTTYDQDKLDRHYKYWNRDFNDSCRFCHKRIPVGTKEAHMKAEHGKSAEELADMNLTADAFTCRKCGERLKSRHARRDHEKKHNPNHTCPLCPYTTSNQEIYINHGRKHRVILVCCECLAKFHSSHALKEHLKDHVSSHGRVGEVGHLYEKSINKSVFVASVLDESSIPECDIIGLDMGMRVREEERRVTQQHSGETGQRPIALPVTVDEMRCLQFGEEYDCFVANIAYRRLSMPTLSYMFARYGRRECPYCGFLLHSSGSWQIHVASHEGKAHLHCAECDYKCRHKFLLDRHIQITHKKQDFPCDICGKRFPYREYVYLHKRKDHESGVMKCTFCTEVPFQTEDEKAMKWHIIEEHPEMTSKQIAEIVGRKVHFTGRDGFLFVNCKYCQKGFSRVAFLRQHVQLAHMQKKEFVCEQCGYKSHTKARLNTHMAVHTEVRNVTCNQCGAGFKNKVYLYKHIRRSHKRYATEKGAAYCKRTRLKNVISLLQKEREEGSSYERQEIIQKEKAKLFGIDNKGLGSVEGVGTEAARSQPTQINVFQCGDCGEYFDSIHTLKKHFTIVHGESPNIPLDFDPGVTGGGSGVYTSPNSSEQVNIALDALNNTSNSTSVNQLFQCAKCNRMFPDMKSVEHHVKEVHATDTFLISEEGDIPSQELDLAAEVINHLTRESGQSGAISMMQSVISQSTLDALSLEAHNAATALTTLPDAVLEMSNSTALEKSETIEPASFNNPQQNTTGVGAYQQETTSVASPKQEPIVVGQPQQETKGADMVDEGKDDKVKVIAERGAGIEPASFNNPRQDKTGVGAYQQETTGFGASQQDMTGIATQQDMTGIGQPQQETKDAGMVDESEAEVKLIAERGADEGTKGAGMVDESEAEKVKVIAERGADMEAAELLQSMGIFQQLAANSTSGETAGSTPSGADSPLMVDVSGTNEQVVQHGEGQESVTIMLIEDDQKKE